MTVSYDNKRLLWAMTTAVIVHILLFLYIDMVFPLFQKKLEIEAPLEMFVALGPPVEVPAESEPVQEKIFEQPPLPEPVVPEPVVEPEPVSEPPIEPVAEPEPIPEAAVEPDPETAAPADTAEPTSAAQPAAADAAAPPETAGAPVVRNTAVSEAPAVPSPSFRSLSQGKRLKAPSYPKIARRWKWEGTVRVVIDIAPDGNIISVELVASSGHEILDEEVLTTIEEYWSFNPPGRRVKINKNFTYRLS